jgi:hypothetical protein
MSDILSYSKFSDFLFQESNWKIDSQLSFIKAPRATVSWLRESGH